MRILFTSHYALPHVGGMEVAIDALARELNARGHEVVHLASSATSPYGRASPDAGYRVVRVAALNAPEERLRVPWPVFGPQLVPRLRAELARVDIVHAHGMLYTSSVLALVMATRRGLPRVLTEHVGHVDYESGALNRIEALAIRSVGRVAVRRAQAVIVLNEKVASEVRALAPLQRVLWIPNGVDISTYRPPEPGERERVRQALGWDDRPRVLFVGRLVAKKGLELAVNTAARAGGAFELVIVGPGRPRVPLPATVRHLGAQPATRVAELYRAADALLLPSRGEGFPLSVQEAMASDLPVVVRDDADYAAYLDGAGAGARRVADDPAALAAALVDLLGDPAARRNAGAAAGAHARTRFSWSRTADRHEALYREVQGSL